MSREKRKHQMLRRRYVAEVEPDTSADAKPDAVREPGHKPGGVGNGDDSDSADHIAVPAQDDKQRLVDTDEHS
jgi:hypothetical protein